MGKRAETFTVSMIRPPGPMLDREEAAEWLAGIGLEYVEMLTNEPGIAGAENAQAMLRLDLQAMMEATAALLRGAESVRVGLDEESGDPGNAEFPDRLFDLAALLSVATNGPGWHEAPDRFAEARQELVSELCQRIRLLARIKSVREAA